MNRTSEETLPLLPILRSLGGCGGTLVTRVLAAHAELIVLSETNPRSAQLYGGLLNPVEQIERWHPAFRSVADEFDAGEIGYPPRFGDLIVRLDETARKLGRRLVVRDYNYVDFIGIPFVWPAANDSSLDAAIDGRFRPAAVSIVRHPADQLASLRSHAAIRGVLDATRFVAAYRLFLDATARATRYRYEDLVARPATAFADLFATLELPFRSDALREFTSVHAVTGNLRNKYDARIAAPPRSADGEAAAIELRSVREYDALLRELDYAG